MFMFMFMFRAFNVKIMRHVHCKKDGNDKEQKQIKLQRKWGDNICKEGNY